MLRLVVMFDRRGWRLINQALETGMAGEIRAKMEELRRARFAMLDGISREIDAVKNEVLDVHSDGLDAMRLPRAELDATKQEISEIREEFAPMSNGAPPGPLPGTGATSPKLSATSGASAPPSTIKPPAVPDITQIAVVDVAPAPKPITPTPDPIASGGVIRLPTEDAANIGG